MSSAPSTDGAKIVPFPGHRETGIRPPRDDESRGTVLFFTGIRYDRKDRDGSVRKPAPTRRKRV